MSDIRLSVNKVLLFFPSYHHQLNHSHTDNAYLSTAQYGDKETSLLLCI